VSCRFATCWALLTTCAPAHDDLARSAGRVGTVGCSGAGRMGDGRRGVNGGGRMRWSWEGIARSGGGCGGETMRRHAGDGPRRRGRPGRHGRRREGAAGELLQDLTVLIGTSEDRGGLTDREIELQ
jgi:hypothetical protein